MTKAQTVRLLRQLGLAKFQIERLERFASEEGWDGDLAALVRYILRDYYPAKDPSE